MVVSQASLGELSWRAGLILAGFNLMLVALALSAVTPRAGRSHHLALALLIFVAYKLLQRVQDQQPLNRSSLKIRSSVMVGPREKVVWLEANGEQFLIGVGPGQVRFLTPLSNGSVTEDITDDWNDGAVPQTATQASWLKQQLNKIHGR